MEEIEIGGACSTYGLSRSAFRFLMGKREGKRPLVRHRRIWQYNNKMDFQEVARGCIDCMKLAQDSESWRAFLNALMSLRVP